MLHVAGLGDEDHVLGDVGRVVGHPLEVLGDQDRLHGRARTLRTGLDLLQGQGDQALLLAIDVVVLFEDLTRLIGVASAEGIERLAQEALRLACQRDEFPIEVQPGVQRQPGSPLNAKHPDSSDSILQPDSRWPR